jgi:inorganic pyrophosphatase/exopolyphosphatase
MIEKYESMIMIIIDHHHDLEFEFVDNSVEEVNHILRRCA